MSHIQVLEERTRGLEYKLDQSQNRIKQLELEKNQLEINFKECENGLSEQKKDLNLAEAKYKSLVANYENDLTRLKTKLDSSETKYMSLINSPSSVELKIVTNNAKKPEWRDKNLSGHYHLVEIVNQKPVYKVSRHSLIEAIEFHLAYYLY